MSSAKPAPCHPEKPLYAFGMCYNCYLRQRRRDKRNGMVKTCECGCGEVAPLGSYYIVGHNGKTEVSRQRTIKMNSTRVHTKETRAKLRANYERMRDVLQSPEVREKIRLAAIGRPMPDHVRATHSKRMSGRIVSDEMRRKVARYGPENHRWRGGICQYPSGWRGIAKKIKERDGFACLICRKVDYRNGKGRQDVHHIDGTTTNNDWRNLITLCHKCHTTAHADLIQSATTLHNILRDCYGYIYD